MSLPNMKSTKADSCNKMIGMICKEKDAIDELIDDNIRLSQEVASLRKLLSASSYGTIVYDPSRIYCLTPTSLSSSALTKSSTSAKKDCYDKREGEYNKSER